MVAATYTEQGIIEALKHAITALEKEISANEDPAQRTRDQILASIARGVLLTIDNHYQCPALRFYTSFRGWLLPILFGLAMAALAGGLYAFQRFGIQMPAP